jgi:hypothetical protein
MFDYGKKVVEKMVEQDCWKWVVEKMVEQDYWQ